MNHPFSYMLLFVIFSIMCTFCSYKVSDFLVKWYLSMGRKNTNFDKYVINFGVYFTICPMFVSITITLFRKTILWLGV